MSGIYDMETIDQCTSLDEIEYKLSDMAKFALDDVRQRQRSILELIYATDRQAMTLLGFSLTIASVAGSGAFTMWWRVFGELADQRPFVVSAFFGLTVLSLGFISVAAWCLTVMRSRNVGLPGRGAAFWALALREKWTEEWLVTQYLNQTAEGDAVSLAGARQMARDLGNARGVAVATCLLALGVALTSPIIHAIAG